jgi:hypothetical protein
MIRGGERRAVPAVRVEVPSLMTIRWYFIAIYPIITPTQSQLSYYTIPEDIE